ncbi:MAG: aromatic ring-hydroxylating dioxygenase subunit alpha [Actinomycetota bacterium]
MEPREVLVDLAQRTLDHAKAGTVPLGDSVGRVPASNYHDRERWASEMAAVFRRVPLVLGFSCELTEPHAWKALEVAGTPILLTRNSAGEIRSFVNMCSHRGAQLVEPGLGVARRFVCPYHAWNYDSDGALVGILDRDEFGEIDVDCHGLTPLPVAERAGIIFGAVAPDAPFDLDAWMCGYDDQLAFHHLDQAEFAGAQSVEGPNWKVAYDGYLDFYHLPILHKNTFGPDYSNKAIYDAWGPHQRVSSPDHRMLKLDSVPKDEWTDTMLTSGVWTIFPHTSIAGFDVAVDGVEGGGRMYMVSTLFPGDSPDTSKTVQNFLAMFEITDELRSAIEAQMKFLLHVVRDEDYFTGNRIQQAVKTGAKSEFLFGRNEIGGQRFHGWVDRLIAAESDDDLANVLASAEVAIQR